MEKRCFWSQFPLNHLHICNVLLLIYTSVYILYIFPLICQLRTHQSKRFSTFYYPIYGNIEKGKRCVSSLQPGRQMPASYTWGMAGDLKCPAEPGPLLCHLWQKHTEHSDEMLQCQETRLLFKPLPLNYCSSFTLSWLNFLLYKMKKIILLATQPKGERDTSPSITNFHNNGAVLHFPKDETIVFCKTMLMTTFSMHPNKACKHLGAQQLCNS